jgi:hypothetical protein
MSETLYLVAGGLSDKSLSETIARKNSGELQAKLWEQISFIKRFTHKNEEDLAYPIEKEGQLLDKIEVGDKAASQEILNEILGISFFPAAAVSRSCAPGSSSWSCCCPGPRSAAERTSSRFSA